MWQIDDRVYTVVLPPFEPLSVPPGSDFDTFVDLILTAMLL